MPTEEFRNLSDLAQFREIRDRHIDDSFEVWLLIGGEWARIVNNEPPGNISRLCLALEASLNPGNPLDYNIIHICREAPCKYEGLRLAMD